MRKLLLVVLAVIYGRPLHAQCVQASFVLPDTFCVANPITLQNTSTGNGLKSRWNFCQVDFLSASPASSYIGLQGYNFKDFDMIKLQNQYLVLAFDTLNLAYINFNYGSNILNPNPVMVIKSGPKVNCFDFVNEGDSLVGLGIYSPTNLLYLISFPNGINAIPLSTPLPSFPSFNHPTSLKLVYADNTYYALVTNQFNNTLTCLSFGNSLLNTPVELYSYTVSLANGLKDFDVDMTCNQITGFCISSGNGSIVKLDFGAGIDAAPTAETDLGNFGSSLGKLSLQLVQEKNSNYLFYVEDFYTGFLRKINFPGNNYNAPAAATNVINYFYRPGIVQILSDSANFHVVVTDDSIPGMWDIPYPVACGSNSYSEDFSPAISFLNTGWNKITLSVTDSAGYNSTTTDSVFIVNGPTASFSVTGNTCYNTTDSIAFTDLSTSPSGPVNNWSWDFDDGYISSAQNPYHHFAGPGIYHVKLTIQAGCPKDTVVTVVIKDTPVVSFSTPTGCAGASLMFTDQTTAGTATLQSWQWNFGDQTAGSSLQHPSHAYALGGTYAVQLLVETTDGCKDSIDLPVVIQSTPLAAFGISNTCAGDTVNFINLSTINDNSVLTYFWDFGNSGDTSILESPTYHYPAASNYVATLIAYSNQGCTDTIAQAVVISNPPAADFIYQPVNCQNSLVSFTDNSTGTSISSWVWDFGDGDSAWVQNPDHSYSTSGSFTVTLIVSAGNNCTSVLSQNITITPGPEAHFTALPVCEGAATAFIDQSTTPAGTNLTSWYYTFGDSNAQSIANPSYTYGNAGSYLATLEIIASNGCSDSISQLVVVHDLPMANFLVQSLRCAGSTIYLIDQSTVNNSILTNWQWVFSNGDSSIQQDPFVTFNNPGAANALLTVTSAEGCSNQTLQSFTILAPPQFTYTFNSTCKGDSTRFNYLPLSGGNANFAWSWSFGDGAYGFVPNPRHLYTQSGLFPVYLVVTDSTGCSTSVLDTVTVYGRPDAHFLSNGICQFEPVQFINQTISNNASIIGWNWNFGDGEFSTDSIPEHQYASTGNFTQTLIVYAAGGCNDTITNLVNIKPEPIAGFTVSPVTGAPNNLINFMNSSTGAVQYLWQFGPGHPTLISQNATFSYADTGRYEISLIATSLYGCTDTAYRFIDIIDPYLDLVMKSISYSVNEGYLKLDAFIANAGNVNATTYDLEVNLEGGINFLETGTDTIPYSGEKLYHLNSRYKVSQGNIPAYACVNILNVNQGPDGNLTNNKKCIPLTSGLYITSIHPNPVQEILNIAYTLPIDAVVDMEIFDSHGKRISELYNASEKAGLIQHSFPVSSLNAAVYYIRFAAGDEIQFIKFIKL